ncbi:hypothetical protein T484DRAFT_1748840 [Baffinella frigidus]|nr:hypothetical protein T484DRAFT_1748840 [Cryptophyta sp. CCMP2293]
MAGAAKLWMPELGRVPLDTVDAKAILSPPRSLHKPLPLPPSASGTTSGSWLDQATSLFTTIVAEPLKEVEELIRKGPGARARSPEPRAAKHTAPIDIRRLNSSPEPRQTRIDSVRASDATVKAESHLQGRTRSSEPQRSKLQIEIPTRRGISSESSESASRRILTERWLDVHLEEPLGAAPRQPPSPQSCPARPCLRLPHHDGGGTPKFVTFSVAAPAARTTKPLTVRLANLPPQPTVSQRYVLPARLDWPLTTARPAASATAPRERGRLSQRN